MLPSQEASACTYYTPSHLTFFLPSKFLRPPERVQGAVSTMPFNGKGNLFSLNPEQFDFNLQFESVLFFILTSVLFFHHRYGEL